MATADYSGTAPACATETPTTFLATDTDFLQAEAELRRVLAEADASGDNDTPEFEAMGDRWRSLHSTILGAGNQSFEKLT